jgi:hypothetical protein
MTTVSVTTPSASTSTPANDDETTAALVTCGDDPEAAVAILAVDAGVTQQTADRTARENAELTEEHENDDQVAAMRHKASLLGTQAWVDFGCSVGEMCVQAGDAAAGASGGAGAGGGSAGSEVQAIQAFGKLCDGLLTAKETNADADAKAAQNASQVAGFAVQADGESLSGATTLVQSALSAYQQYVSTQAQTQAAALHRA